MATKQLLPELLELVHRQEGRCHWCGREIVALSEVPERDIVKRDHFRVWYFERGQVIKRMVADRDHLVPKMAKRIGITCSPTDKVASCRECNLERGRRTTSYLSRRMQKYVRRDGSLGSPKKKQRIVEDLRGILPERTIAKVWLR